MHLRGDYVPVCPTKSIEKGGIFKINKDTCTECEELRFAQVRRGLSGR